MQSELLTGAVGFLLVARFGIAAWAMHQGGPYPHWFWYSCGFSAAFALLVWRLRSATAPAAVMGGLVCMNVLLNQAFRSAWWSTALPALLALFVLTFAATRFGRRRKELMGLAEPKRGRRASQVLANLGVAGLCAGTASPLWFAACIAALAEATADTVSSETGQALGGRTLLITSWQEVPAGTDGGISIAGTTLGVMGAGILILTTTAAASLSYEAGMAAFGAAVAGLLFDSILGATVERRGWLGNDLVNVASTLFSAGLAYGLLRWG